MVAALPCVIYYLTSCPKLYKLLVHYKDKAPILNLHQMIKLKIQSRIGFPTSCINGIGTLNLGLQLAIYKLSDVQFSNLGVLGHMNNSVEFVRQKYSQLQG